MKKTLWLALCLLLSYHVSKADDYAGMANSASIAFRSTRDHLAGVSNEVGETTYSHASDVGVNLSIGTRYGTVYATDPYAIKKPTVRPARNSEWTIVPGEGVSLSTNGIVFFDDGLDITNTTRYVDIVPTTSNRIARVDVVKSSREVVSYPTTRMLANGVCRISCEYDDSMPKIGSHEKIYCVMQDFSVHVFDNDLEKIEYDFTNGDVKIKDSVGDTTLGTFRHWMTNYYHQTEYDWSLRTARHDIRTGGHRFIFNDKFWFGLGDSTTATNTLSVYAAGKSLMTFTPAFEAVSPTGSNMVSRSWAEWVDSHPNWGITNFYLNTSGGVSTATFLFEECTVTGAWYTVLYGDNLNFENATQSQEYHSSPIVFKHSDTSDRNFYKVVVHPPDQFDDGEEIESQTISVHDRIEFNTDVYMYGRLICDRDGYVRYESLERALRKLATDGIEIDGTVYKLAPVQQ